MIASYILAAFVIAMVSFMLGWWRGGSDHSADMQPAIDKLRDTVMSMRTDCAHCGALYKAMCPKGCPPPPAPSSGGGA